MTGPLTATGWAQLAWVITIGTGLHLLVHLLLEAWEKCLQAYERRRDAEQRRSRQIADGLRYHSTPSEARRDE